MKTTLPAESARDLKDYESLIENGYVLDVHGQWIPLNEKIKKERSFIKHLESGEVLISGRWLTISEALKKVDQQEQQLIEDRSNTANSHDETQTSFDVETSEHEVEFPPETIMIPAEELLQNNPNFQDSIQKSKKDVTINNQKQNAEESIITQETIAISLHALPEITAQYQKPFGNPELMDSDLIHSKKQLKLFPGVATIVFILCTITFLALKLLPGLFK